MGKLVRLSNYRSKRLRPWAGAPVEHPYYYCTRCESQKFTLGSEGEVQCAGCGALMRNLAVRDER